MEQDPGSNPSTSSAVKRSAGSFGAFLVVFVFVWIVFDNLALAFLFALMAGGGAEAAQRAAANKTGDGKPD